MPHCLARRQQCLQVVLHPLLQEQDLSKETAKMKARLCTQQMRTILGREESGVADLNTKGVIGFWSKAQGCGHGLTLKRW